MQAEAYRSVSCPVNPIDGLCFPTGVLTHSHPHSALWSSEKISNGFNAEDFEQSLFTHTHQMTAKPCKYIVT